MAYIYPRFCIHSHFDTAISPTQKIASIAAIFANLSFVWQSFSFTKGSFNFVDFSYKYSWERFFLFHLRTLRPFPSQMVFNLKLLLFSTPMSSFTDFTKKEKNLYLTLINSLTRTRNQINNRGFFDLLERQNFLFQLN